MIGSGEIVHVSISVSCKTNSPLDDATIKVVKNACYGGAGDLAGGTQIGTDLNKNNNQQTQFWTNLTGFTFAQGDVLSVYVEKNPDSLNKPYVRLYIRYD